jgi:hypothetical protein
LTIPLFDPHAPPALLDLESWHVGRLQGDSIVVRGGSLVVDDLVRQAAIALGRWGGYEISAACLPDQDANAIARSAAVQGWLPQAKYRVSSVSRITEAGYVVLPIRRPEQQGHVSIFARHLGGVARDDWMPLVEAFDEAQENPYRRRRG